MDKKLQAAVDQMYWALRASSCGCCGKWKMVKGIKGVWVITKVCSRCKALEAYEKALAQNDKSPELGALDVPLAEA